MSQQVEDPEAVSQHEPGGILRRLRRDLRDGAVCFASHAAEGGPLVERRLGGRERREQRPRVSEASQGCFYAYKSRCCLRTKYKLVFALVDLFLLWVNESKNCTEYLCRNINSRVLADNYIFVFFSGPFKTNQK